jgi:predicted outer membrane repeat protein
MKKNFYLLTILALLLLPVMAPWSVVSAKDAGASSQAPPAPILYVMPGGSGDCTSWANACELQAALLGAVSGDEIWVQAGVYTPTAGTDRTATFILKSGVALYGGFAGTETEREQRNWETNVTTLSGDIGVAADNSDNSYHVVTGNGVVAAVLDGFTITGGKADGASLNGYGGGVYNNANSLTLTNITFSGNNATYGGGIYNTSSNPVLENVSFSDNNAADDGGGMLNDNSNPALTDVEFTGNTAVDSGGGMRNLNASGPSLNGVVFSGNTANFGGGMSNQGSSPTLTDVSFSANSAVSNGGGMYNYQSSPTLTNVTFSGNYAAYGGGMYNSSSSPTLTDVTFSDNSAVNYGGGMQNSLSSPTLTNITFSDNDAIYGGGIYNSSSNPILGNVRISDNNAADDGGGMLNDNSNPALTDVEFTGNTAVDSGGGMRNLNASGPSLNGVVFSGNTANFGGGMSNQGSSPTLTDVSFSVNSAVNNGGGIYNSASSPALTSGTFSGNIANRGGGMYNASSSNPTLANLIFSSNTANFGGGMYNASSNPALGNVSFSSNTVVSGGGMYNSSSSPTLTEVTFSGNYASQNAGGMFNTISNPELTDVEFISNTAVDFGGGMYNASSSNPTLVNVSFSGNYVNQNGGGMYNNLSNPTLTNDTFSGNFASQSGGGMYNYGSSPTLTNVTFSSNYVGQNGGGMDNFYNSSPTITNAILWGNTADQIFNHEGSTPIISYSDIYGGCPAGATCSQVINLDPQFIRSPFPGADGTWGTPDDDYGDLHLQLTSPAIDAGDNTSVPAGVVTDLDGNPRFIDILSVPDTGNGTAPIVDMGAYETYGETAPPNVVSILRADPSPTNAASVDYTVTFSEAVTGVGVSDFTLTLSGITGASVTGVSGGPTIYTVAVSTGTGNGTLRLDVPGTASITDLVGNPLSGLPYTGGESYTIDKTAPMVVSILRADPSPTNASSVNYTVTFSEAVTGVGVSDFTLTLSGITGASVTGVSGGPTIYTVAVSTGTGSGSLRLDVPGTASITDGVGNPLSGLPYTGGESYTIDKTAPTVVSILRANPSPTNAASVDYTVTFSEAVTGVGASDFTLTLSGITGATVTGVSGGPTIYTVAVSTGTGDGTLRLDVPGTASIMDLVGNPLSVLPYTGGELYTIDKTAPMVVSILRADPSPTNAASVDYTVTFSEAVTDVGASDFTLTLSGITGASVTGVSGGPTTYNVAVSTGTGSGSLRLDVPGTASITDGVGNPLSGLPYTGGESYTIDKTAPTVVSILRADPNPTNATSVHFIVTFSEEVSGVDIGDFSVFTTGTISGSSVTNVSDTGTVYIVTVSVGTGSGSLRLDIPGTALIADVVGNPLSGLPYDSGEAYSILWKIFLTSVMKTTP